MPVHRRCPQRCSPGPDCLCRPLGCPDHRCPALCGSAPAHLAKGTRAPLFARVDREGGDAPEGGARPGPRQMEAHTKPSLRGSWQRADNALIQEPDIKGTKCPGAVNSAVPGGRVEVMSGIWASVMPPSLPCAEGPPEGAPQALPVSTRAPER